MVRQIALALAASISIGCAQGGIALEDSDAAAGVGEVAIDAKSSPAEAACTRLAFEQCKAWMKCDPIGVARRFGDVTTCTSRLEQECNARYGDPGAGETPEIVAACTTAAGTIDCSRFARWMLEENGEPPSACAVAGKIATGSGCVRNGQCESGACAVDSTQPCGTCVERAAVGAACSATSSCPLGARCADTQCVRYGSLAATCDLISHPCAADLVCLDKKCAPRVTDGAPCTNFDHCQFGLVCNATTKKCEKWTLAKPGEVCGLSASKGFVGCVYGAKCKITNTETYAGTCVAAAKVSEPCTFEGPVDSACNELTVCIAGKCAVREGKACK